MIKKKKVGRDPSTSTQDTQHTRSAS